VQFVDILAYGAPPSHILLKPLWNFSTFFLNLNLTRWPEVYLPESTLPFKR